MRLGRRNALLLGVIGVAAAAAGAVVGALFLQSRSGAAPLLSARFPDLAGRERRLLDWQGHVLVVNFWATWCAPCREEMPMFAEARRAYAAKSVEFIGIGIDSPDKMREFSITYGIEYPLLVADAGAIELMRNLGNRTGGLPYTVVLDRAGSVSHRQLGPLSRAELDRVLQALLR